ncbi:MAG: hypothetical protein JGK17_00615 [Microcoleus sp. PH2017_10_PVI_O_A]|uniref:hypothetical protein n=1 Tax=unclassified Microcoleus TaxID=2642155 RepID=UPI001D82C73F|nr:MULTISPECIES: hypothetical protein [unclassified Microcoleus]TAE84889.1 MAG: hypothetical protein EAZ83_04750 [Oscillatoriales cyanobacterium]MCC3404121.1 hypothetical protein [Microcoleus sp. PH2017_10_PVI_O_A]MCC3458205.1 hypothetical protein [Microcoleus sp. PH2017_11_PCY_U_A]MCC3476708.1 hypothetical protein [Microcoleus sp. PH2017_12_PCY_D_A]MCC3557748.1 hypothetical protein [Microcoleus sp. PH2017_27_LUM_O_A]
MSQNGYQQGLSANPSAIAYQKRLYPWAIAKLMPNMQRTVVCRFRRRSDADGGSALKERIERIKLTSKKSRHLEL